MLDIDHGMAAPRPRRAPVHPRGPRLVLSVLALAVLAASAQARPAAAEPATAGLTSFQFGPRLAPPQPEQPAASPAPAATRVLGNAEGPADKDAPGRKWRPYRGPCNYTTGCH